MLKKSKWTEPTCKQKERKEKGVGEGESKQPDQQFIGQHRKIFLKSSLSATLKIHYSVGIHYVCEYFLWYFTSTLFNEI